MLFFEVPLLRPEETDQVRRLLFRMRRVGLADDAPSRSLAIVTVPVLRSGVPMKAVRCLTTLQVLHCRWICGATIQWQGTRRCAPGAVKTGWPPPKAGIRHPVHVIEGNCRPAPGACPWWDQALGRGK